MALIGVSGYAGSGKDTVGKIIKDLRPETNWEIKKFAGKLKDVAEILTGINKDLFEDQDFKKTNLSRDWWTTCDEGWQPMTVRDLLQKLGTDALRKGLHENTWVNALMADYRQNSNWVITDTRFPNEAQAIKNKGGIIIRVDRPGFTKINEHPSETALDGWNFDYKIANVSDTVALAFTVKCILEEIKL